MSEKLNEIFDVTPVREGDVITSGNVVVPQHSTQVEKNVDTDYEITRSNLHSLLQQGQEALMHSLEIAKSSEHPRAFEVVGNLMKQLSDINHQLLALSERKQRMGEKKDTPQAQTQQPVQVQNAVFVGSTAELSKIIAKGE